MYKRFNGAVQSLHLFECSQSSTYFKVQMRRFWLCNHRFSSGRSLSLEQLCGATASGTPADSSDVKLEDSDKCATNDWDDSDVTDLTSVLSYEKDSCLVSNFSDDVQEATNDAC